MQLHTRAHLLASPHTCANLCPVISDGTLARLTYCRHVLQEGLYTHVYCSHRYMCRYVHLHFSLMILSDLDYNDP